MSVLPVRRQRYSMRSFVDATLDVIDTTVLANVLLDFYRESQSPLVVWDGNLLASSSRQLMIGSQIATSVDLVDHQSG